MPNKLPSLENIKCRISKNLEERIKALCSRNYDSSLEDYKQIFLLGFVQGKTYNYVGLTRVVGTNLMGNRIMGAVYLDEPARRSIIETDINRLAMELDSLYPRVHQGSSERNLPYSFVELESPDFETKNMSKYHKFRARGLSRRIPLVYCVLLPKNQCQTDKNSPKTTSIELESSFWFYRGQNKGSIEVKYANGFEQIPKLETVADVYDRSFVASVELEVPVDLHEPKNEPRHNSGHKNVFRLRELLGETFQVPKMGILGKWDTLKLWLDEGQWQTSKLFGDLEPTSSIYEHLNWKFACDACTNHNGLLTLGTRDKKSKYKSEIRLWRKSMLLNRSDVSFKLNFSSTSNDETKILNNNNNNNNIITTNNNNNNINININNNNTNKNDPNLIKMNIFVRLHLDDTLSASVRRICNIVWELLNEVKYEIKRWNSMPCRMLSEFFQIVPATFKADKIDHFIYGIFLMPRGGHHSITCASMRSQRQRLHQDYVVTMKHATFRLAQRLVMPSISYAYSKHWGPNLVHLPITTNPAFCRFGQVAVSAHYDFCHRDPQDHLDDDRWDYCYNALFTLVSWYKNTGYACGLFDRQAPIDAKGTQTTRDISMFLSVGIPPPNYKLVQMVLSDRGKFCPAKVGDFVPITVRQGADYLYAVHGISSKYYRFGLNSRFESILNLMNLLRKHFVERGSPVWIATCKRSLVLIGLDEGTQQRKETKFLLLNPGYSDSDDSYDICTKGGCFWVKPEFWSSNREHWMLIPMVEQDF